MFRPAKDISTFLVVIDGDKEHEHDVWAAHVVADDNHADAGDKATDNHCDNDEHCFKSHV